MKQRIAILEAELAEHPDILKIIDAPTKTVPTYQIDQLKREIAEAKIEITKITHSTANH